MEKKLETTIASYVGAKSGMDFGKVDREAWAHGMGHGGTGRQTKPSRAP